MTPRRLEALSYGLRLTGGAGFFGTPEGVENPYDSTDEANLERGLKYLLETDLRASLEARAASFRFPVAVFQSEHDGIVRPENAGYLKGIFPGADVRYVPGTEHALPIFIPELIDEAVSAIEAVV